MYNYFTYIVWIIFTQLFVYVRSWIRAAGWDTYRTVEIHVIVILPLNLAVEMHVIIFIIINLDVFAVGDGGGDFLCVAMSSKQKIPLKCWPCMMSVSSNESPESESVQLSLSSFRKRRFAALFQPQIFQCKWWQQRKSWRLISQAGCANAGSEWLARFESRTDSGSTRGLSTWQTHWTSHNGQLSALRQSALRQIGFHIVPFVRLEGKKA